MTGTYRNPVLHADWSDPDVIRVGDDFYLVASSFHRVPGLPILHSRDLVNWSIIGHGLPWLEPEAWVTTVDGADWFLHFQDKGAFGRVVHLQPMRWVDGWPSIGAPPGQPVLSHAKPSGSGVPTAPAAGDDFAGPVLGAQWAWAGNPDPGWWSFQPGGGLRLACVPSGGDLRRLPNLLGQRLPADRFRATTTLRLTGARAGLTILGRSYAWIGLEGRTLVHRVAGEGEPERDAAPPVAVGDAAVAVGVEVTPDGYCQFLAGERPVGPPFAATAGHWVGATLGLFAAGDGGVADVTALHITGTSP